MVVDYFTKWAEAFSIPDQFITIAKILSREVFSRFGWPLFLHSDQGANLCAKVIQDLSEINGLVKTRTSAYRPESDGQAENA